MYCQKCGTRLPPGALYCFKCGAPVNTGKNQENSPNVEPQWEYCEIVFDKKQRLLYWEAFFWAKAISSDGVYEAAKSPIVKKWDIPEVPKRDDQSYARIHNLLINQLIAEGWEHTGDRGEKWWNVRFRRNIIIEKSTADLAVIIGADQQIIDLLNQGLKIKAVKVYQKSAGVGMREAKQYVDEVHRKLKLLKK